MTMIFTGSMVIYEKQIVDDQPMRRCIGIVSHIHAGSQEGTIYTVTNGDTMDSIIYDQIIQAFDACHISKQVAGEHLALVHSGQYHIN
jgi:hypothetical protein